MDFALKSFFKTYFSIVITKSYTKINYVYNVYDLQVLTTKI